MSKAKLCAEVKLTFKFLMGPFFFFVMMTLNKNIGMWNVCGKHHQ